MLAHHRRPIWLLFASGFFLAFAACGGSSTIAPTAPTAAALLQTASDNFAKDTSLHFTLSADKIAPGVFAVTQAEGDVARPDRLKVTGSVEVTKGLNAGLGLVLIGADQYVDIGGTGKYTKTNGLPNLLLIFDANNGIGSILKQVQNPSAPVSEKLGNIQTWKTSGTVPSTTLAPLTGASPTATATPVQTTLWIGQDDGQVHQVKLVGVATDGDTVESTRIIVLSNFNQPVTINVPTT